ncbi:hypothetical protein B0H63DRAFT_197943 [Podospora didyma]|uniref:Uncharacterized protein n=1 Tax=Podospora didyma TaxID=330526 RepID=A0AAE0TVR2_9PEZI|nr:hypothetical protein B0H63DRAFT_197943 [Podospora didyma]
MSTQYISPRQHMDKHMSSPKGLAISHGATASWLRKSTTVTRHSVYKAPLFGTLLFQTIMATYVRGIPAEADEGSGLETEPQSQTSVTFLPAAWLSSSGARFQYGAITHPAPAWSIHCVNVIPFDSEIFICCRNLDLANIRNLFDKGEASPYDVDKSGRNLLGYLALGTREAIDVIPQRLRYTIAIVDMLLSYGLDPGDEGDTG